MGSNKSICLHILIDSVKRGHEILCTNVSKVEVAEMRGDIPENIPKTWTIPVWRHIGRVTTSCSRSEDDTGQQNPRSIGGRADSPAFGVLVGILLSRLP